MAFEGVLSLTSPGNAFSGTLRPWPPAPGEAPAGANQQEVRWTHVRRKRLGDSSPALLPPQDLHHLGHQQLVPPRAGPSGPSGPRRSPARRQPQPVPQRHFNGNCWLGGQTRKMRVPGRVWGVTWAAICFLVAVGSVNGSRAEELGIYPQHIKPVTQAIPVREK